MKMTGTYIEWTTGKYEIVVRKTDKGLFVGGWVMDRETHVPVFTIPQGIILPPEPSMRRALLKDVIGAGYTAPARANDITGQWLDDEFDKVAEVTAEAVARYIVAKVVWEVMQPEHPLLKELAKVYAGS